MNAFDLSGRRALVTGARRGIGFAMASALAEAGADIVAVSASIPEHGSELEERVLGLGREFEAIACDFADADAVRRWRTAWRTPGSISS